MHYQRNKYQMVGPQESRAPEREKGYWGFPLSNNLKLITAYLEGLLRSPLWLTQNLDEMLDAQIGLWGAMWN